MDRSFCFGKDRLASFGYEQKLRRLRIVVSVPVLNEKPYGLTAFSVTPLFDPKPHADLSTTVIPFISVPPPRNVFRPVHHPDVDVLTSSLVPHLTIASLKEPDSSPAVPSSPSVPFQPASPSGAPPKARFDKLAQMMQAKAKASASSPQPASSSSPASPFSPRPVAFLPTLSRSSK
jgi:hypothetical protein